MVPDAVRGGVWAGTRNGGLAHIKGASVRPLSEINGLVSNRVRSLLQRTNGDLVIGTVDGIAILDPTRSAAHCQTSVRWSVPRSLRVAAGRRVGGQPGRRAGPSRWRRGDLCRHLCHPATAVDLRDDQPPGAAARSGPVAASLRWTPPTSCGGLWSRAPTCGCSPSTPRARCGRRRATWAVGASRTVVGRASSRRRGSTASCATPSSAVTGRCGLPARAGCGATPSSPGSV